MRYANISSGTSRQCTWDSLYQWNPLLQPSYADILNRNCLKYPHYLDTARGKINDIPSLKKNTCNSCYTALEEDVFVPTGYYMNEKGTSIVFYSGCSIVVTPYEKDFVGPIKPSTRTMNGLSASDHVKGEGEVT